jgi:hypothetical protein
MMNPTIAETVCREIKRTGSEEVLRLTQDKVVERWIHIEGQMYGLIKYVDGSLLLFTKGPGDEPGLVGIPVDPRGPRDLTTTAASTWPSRSSSFREGLVANYFHLFGT